MSVEGLELYRVRQRNQLDITQKSIMKIQKIKPVTDVENYRGINIFITPIINQGVQTGTQYQFTVGSMKRQAFTLAAAHSLIDDILAVQLPPEPNPLLEVTDRAKVQKALRGGQGDLKSEIPFG